MNEDKYDEILNEDKLDELLNEIYSEEILPSQELVNITKASLKKPGMLEYALTFSIITSFAAALFSGYMIIFKLHDIFDKVIAVSITSLITNIIIIFIFLYRNDIKNLFSKLEA
jgi:hypothetical protein